MTTTRDSVTRFVLTTSCSQVNPLASFVPKVGHGRPPITMSRWKMIKEIVSDGIYILKNRRKYSDLEVAKAKKIAGREEASHVERKI